MKEAIFGIAAVLALTTNPVWAGDAKVTEKVSSDPAPSTADARKSEVASRVVSASRDVTISSAEPGSSEAKPVESSEIYDDYWLVARERARDDER